MSDFFPTVRRGLGDAVERCAHLPWYRRMLIPGRLRVMAVVIATLVVATPAVGAATDWFGIGAPNRFPPQSPTQNVGRALPRTSQLLSLRVPDPQGGPPWGLRLVHTTRDDTCIQLGRVQHGELGSLGIDDAWGNDHLFHPFPNSSEGQACGVTDADGDGFVNVAETGVIANANPDVGHGPQAHSCQAIRGGADTEPICPASAVRIVFMGLLGPDATSVSYEAPDHHVKTEKTSGSQGAYLLVFPFDSNTCNLYTTSPSGSVGPCGGTVSFDGSSPGRIGAIKAVTYKDGHTCRLEPSAQLRAAFTTFQQTALATLGPASNKPGGPASPRWLAGYRRLLARFLAREHLTKAELDNTLGQGSPCPPVGEVSVTAPKVTPTQIAATIRVHKYPTGNYGCPNNLHLPQACNGLSPGSGTAMVPIEWSFTARKAVANSRSSYAATVNTPTGPGCTGSDFGFETDSNIQAGTTLRYSQFFPASCHGTYTIVVSFETQTSATANNNAGQDGSSIVGQTNFTIP